MDALTGLRFVAAAAIVAIHTQGRLGVPVDFVGGSVMRSFVALFFVLSGFILTYVHPSLEGPRAWRRFWRARWARIWPAHMVSFLLVLAVVPSWLWAYEGNPAATPHLVRNAIMHVLLVQTWVPGVNGYSAYNGVSWSVSTECAFYVAFPGLLLAARRGKWAWAMAATTVLTLVMLIGGNGWLRWAGFHPGLLLIYVTPLVRMFEFVAGIGLALLFERHIGWRDRALTLRLRLLVAALEIGASIAFVLSMWRSDRIAAAVQPVFGAAGAMWMSFAGAALLPILVLIGSLALQRGPIGWLLARAPFVLLGELSFSIYLLHDPLFRVVQFHPQLVRDVPNSMLLVGYLLLVVVAAYAVWSLIETPGRVLLRGRRPGKRPHRPAPRPCKLSLASGLLTITIIASCVMWSAHAPSLAGYRPARTAELTAALGAINGRTSDQPGHWSLDTPSGSGHRASIRVDGWLAASTRHHDRDIRGAYLMIDGKQRCWLQYGAARPDIADRRIAVTGSCPVSSNGRGEHALALRAVLPRDRRYVDLPIGTLTLREASPVA